MSSNNDQIKTIYKISQILGNAFKQVNNLCANFLAEEVIENKSSNPKVAKSQKQTKAQSTQMKQSKIEQPQPINYANRLDSQKSKPKQVQVQQQKSKPKSQQPVKQQQQKQKKETHPDRPKQPLSAFFLFQSEQKENLKRLHPNVSITQLAKMMGQIWQELSTKQKQPFVKKHQQLKQKYDKEIQKFYQKHPEEKSKKQLKKQKAESRNNKQAPIVSSPVQKAVVPVQKQTVSTQKQGNQSKKAAVKKPVIIEEEQDSV